MSAEQHPCCGGFATHEEWCPTHIRSALTWIEPSLDGVKLRERAETALKALIERDGLVRTLTVTDVLPLARHLYQDATVGCCFHLPLAAGNMDNATVRSCIKAAQQKGHAHCEMMGRVILRLTDEQRDRLARESRRVKKS